MRSSTVSVGFVLAVLASSPGPAAAALMSSDNPSGASYLDRDKPALSGSGADIIHFHDGIAALGKGDLDAAAKNFRAAAQAAPKAPGPLIGLAEVAMRRGDGAAAEKELKKALEVAPNAAFTHSAWANYLITRKDYVAALAELGKAAELAPQWAVPHDQQGDIYLTALHDPKSAMAAYRAALAVDAKDFGAHYALANALLQIGQPRDAKAELIEVTKLAPGSPWGWVALGEAEAQLGEGDAALHAFDTALKIDPGLPAAHIGRGDVLAGRGKAQEAVAAYEAALQADPRSVAALDRLAVEEEAMGRPAAAEKHYRAALAIEPQDLVATNNLAFLLAQERHDLDEALRLATEAAQRSPSSPTALDTLAWVHRARGELPAAEQILRPLADSANLPAPLYHLGVVYAEMGRKHDAIIAFDRALARAPDYRPARDARQKLMDAAQQ